MNDDASHNFGPAPRFLALLLMSAVDEQLEGQNKSYASLAQETGIQELVLHRVRERAQRYGQVDRDIALRLCEWLERPAQDFLYDHSAAQISAHRSGDRLRELGLIDEDGQVGV